MENTKEKQAISENDQALILKCILKHSSKYSGNPDPVEVKIIRSADVLAVLFDKNWQDKSRKQHSKTEYESLIDSSFQSIELNSARKIAEPQLVLLKQA